MPLTLLYHFGTAPDRSCLEAPTVIGAGALWEQQDPMLYLGGYHSLSTDSILRSPPSTATTTPRPMTVNSDVYHTHADCDVNITTLTDYDLNPFHGCPFGVDVMRLQRTCARSDALGLAIYGDEPLGGPSMEVPSCHCEQGGGYHCPFFTLFSRPCTISISIFHLPATSAPCSMN